MKKRRVAVLLSALVLYIWVPQTIIGSANMIVAEAHSGRTDSNGGHRDNKNKSGLGSYHYHCGGYPAHLHTNGICPYTDNTRTVSEESTPVTSAEQLSVPENIEKVFNEIYYAEHNEDVYKSIGDDKESLLKHFLTSGMKEGRVACETFDVNVYKANNEDLVQAYGEELPLYYEHYMKCGYAENRICHQ